MTAGRAPRSDDEAAWLIENSVRLGLGVCGRGMRWVSVSDAIRFSRREDAEAVLSLLGRLLPALPVDELRVTEHSWPDVSQPAGVLPMVIDDGTRFDATSISGGADEVLGMPRTVSIQRTRPNGSTIRAVYVVDVDSIEAETDDAPCPWDGETPETSGLEARR